MALAAPPQKRSALGINEVPMILELSALKDVVSIAAVVCPATWLGVRKVRERWGHLSWGSVAKTTARLHGKMVAAGYRPSYIVGLGRGGAVTGAMLSGRFAQPNIPLIVLTIDHGSSQLNREFYEKGVVRTERVSDCGLVHQGLENVLVLGVDIVNGGAMRAALSSLEEAGVKHSAIACLYMHPDAYIKPTFFGAARRGRLKFPWMAQTFERTWGIPRLPSEASRPPKDDA